MSKLNLTETEYRFACIVWENEPLGSGELVELCNEELGWKKSTTYTVLKRLCDRQIFKNVNATVSAMVKKEQVQKFKSENLLTGHSTDPYPILLQVS